jgi:ABC-type Mn2+/Zn2+ transport system permease subunit
MDIYPDGTLLAAFLLGIPCAVVGPIIMKKTIASIISSIDRLSF